MGPGIHLLLRTHHLLFIGLPLIGPLLSPNKRVRGVTSLSLDVGSQVMVSKLFQVFHTPPRCKTLQGSRNLYQLREDNGKSVSQRQKFSIV